MLLKSLLRALLRVGSRVVIEGSRLERLERVGAGNRGFGYWRGHSGSGQVREQGPVGSRPPSVFLPRLWRAAGTADVAGRDRCGRCRL